jgi:protein involved in polysaccharide export with SLBB domain
MLQKIRRLSLVLLPTLLLAAGTAAAQLQAVDPLRPGDVVRLRIWREPDMSGDFAVDESGMVVLPRVGPVRVTGEAPEKLRARLVSAFEAFLQHSSIEVKLLRRVQVLGAVRNPGLYPVDATMTVADALALAGGTTSDGHPHRVELIRGGKRVPVEITAQTPISATSIRSGDQLFVPERSWLSRNTGLVTAGITGGVSLIIALLTRG